jgi:hypothetical protein
MFFTLIKEESNYLIDGKVTSDKHLAEWYIFENDGILGKIVMILRRQVVERERSMGWFLFIHLVFEQFLSRFIPVIIWEVFNSLAMVLVISTLFSQWNAKFTSGNILTPLFKLS